MKVFTNKKCVTVIDGIFTSRELDRMDSWFGSYTFWGLGHDEKGHGASYSSLCRSLKWDQWVGVHAIINDIMQIMTDRIHAETDIKVPYFHRCLINNFRVGDSPMFHKDSPNNDNGRTFMVYPNKVWNLNWGGYTVFADENNNVIDVSNPYPGRVVIFNGNISHCGLPPARGHQGPGRYSIAYQDPLGTTDPSQRRGCKPEDIEKTSFVSIYGDDFSRLR